jgi:uncharacterized protein
MMPSYGFRAQGQPVEGVAVVGEAVRRVAPETAEFLIEITAGAPTAAQALQNHQTKAAQIAQAVAPMGVQRTDFQTMSLNVLNIYAPVMQALPYYGSVPQIGPGGFGGYAGAPPLQPDVQFGSYQARSIWRVSARESTRVGEIADALTKAGATLAGGICFRAADEAGARKAALEAAGKDARAKAETLAAATGKQVGDPVSVSEEVVASNGVLAALRAQMPLGPGASAAGGELEYYARVTANFRFQ